MECGDLDLFDNESTSRIRSFFRVQHLTVFQILAFPDLVFPHGPQDMNASETDAVKVIDEIVANMSGAPWVCKLGFLELQPPEHGAVCIDLTYLSLYNLH